MAELEPPVACQPLAHPRRFAQIAPALFSWRIDPGDTGMTRGEPEPCHLSPRRLMPSKNGPDGIAELHIDRGESLENRRIFDRIHDQRAEIEKAFGEPLEWERRDVKRASRIKHLIMRGGYRSPESDWPAIHAEMVDAMIRLEAALMPALEAMKLQL